MSPKLLDHIALWVANRDEIVAATGSALGLRVIERTEKFTLLGADARRGKLTLFDAEGPREPGPLKHIALRAPHGDEAEHELGDGLVLRVVPRETDVAYDLDHVALWTADVEATAKKWTRLGFNPVAGAPHRVEVGGAFVEFHEGRPDDPDRPLLNHVGVLVDSAEAHRDEAEALGFELADFVDAPNTLAAFVWGPERVKIEYVEHKPTFSLV